MAVIEALPEVRLKYYSGQVTQPADPLDHHFQDWLADPRIGLMRRNPWAKNLLEKDLPRLGGHQDTGELIRPGQLLQFLLSQEGYLVSTTRVAGVLYNGHAGRSEINCTGQVCHRLRGRLRYPELLYSRAAVGMGVGIEDLELRQFELQLLYPLWRKKEDWVRLDELGQEVYNCADRVVFTNALGVALHKLRKTLSSRAATFTIETQRRNHYQESAYRLRES